MPRLVSIIVLCHDRWSDTRRCLEAVRRSTPPDLYEVLAYDNASTDGTFARLSALARGWPQLKPRRNERNLSFAEGVNKGMREARGDLFLWLNNDTVPERGWLEGLLAALGAGGAAAAGPMTDRMAPLDQVGARFKTKARGRIRDETFLGGFCFLVARAAVERAGPMDERFEWGWEDMDYCLRLRQAGEKLVLARDVFVHHAGSRTLRKMPMPRRRATDFRNRRLILEKWARGEPWRSDFLRLYERMPSPWRSIGPGVSVIVACDGPWPAARARLEALRRSAAGQDCEALLVAGERRRAAELRRWAAAWPAAKVVGPWGDAPPAKAFNRAAALAWGDHLAFLDAGTRVSPMWLAGLRAALRGRPDIGVAAPVGASLGFLVRRDVFARVGGFDERFSGALCGDDYRRRVGEAGFPVVEAPGARVVTTQARPIASIVVACRRDRPTTRRCLEAIRRSAGAFPHEILVAASWGAIHEADALNRALREARGEHVVVMSGDAAPEAGWLEALVEAARSERDVAGAAPACADSDLSWQSRVPPGGARPVRFVRGLCLLIPRRALSLLGDFDDRFRRDLHVEDFCMRAEQRGLKILVSGKARVRRIPKGRPKKPSAHDLKLWFHKWPAAGLLQR